MDPEFWHARWHQGRTGFHRPEVNPLLEEHFPTLALAAGARVLVPLCGKTLDLGWLARHGYAPVGVEISPVAVEAFFAEAGIEPDRSREGPFELWQGDGIEILCGDFFETDPERTGSFDAIWDRAALIALPHHMRPAYVRHCAALLHADAPGLLVSIDYDPGQMDGPPFAVPPAELEDLYAPWFDVETVVEPRAQEPSPHLVDRGLRSMTEAVWRLRRQGRSWGAEE